MTKRAPCCDCGADRRVSEHHGESLRCAACRERLSRLAWREMAAQAPRATKRLREAAKRLDLPR